MKRYPQAARVGSRIQGLRTRKGLSVRTLAGLAGLGHTTLLRIESGEINIPYETLARIADALGVPVRECVPGETEEHGSTPLLPRRIEPDLQAAYFQFGHLIGIDFAQPHAALSGGNQEGQIDTFRARKEASVFSHVFSREYVSRPLGLTPTYVNA